MGATSLSGTEAGLFLARPGIDGRDRNDEHLHHLLSFTIRSKFILSLLALTSTGTVDIQMLDFFSRQVDLLVVFWFDRFYQEKLIWMFRTIVKFLMISSDMGHQ